MANADVATPNTLETTDLKQDHDDERWLYGDSEPKTDTPSADVAESADSSAPEAGELDDDSEAVSTAKDTESGQIEDDDSDEDEDDIQITIGDIKTGAVQPQRFQGTPGAPTSRARPGVTVKTATTKALDINAEGEINGVSTYDFDLDALKNEEMPWRKPGADITDYFNYGFTEDTWKVYAQRQQTLRHQVGSHTKYSQMGNNTIHTLGDTGQSGLTAVQSRVTYTQVGPNVNIVERPPPPTPAVTVRPQQPPAVIVRTPVGASSNVTVLKTTPTSVSAPPPIESRRPDIPDFNVPPPGTVPPPVSVPPPVQYMPQQPHYQMQPRQMFAPPQVAPPRMVMPSGPPPMRMPPPHIVGPPPRVPPPGAGFAGPPPGFGGPPPNFGFNAPPGQGFGPGYRPPAMGAPGTRGVPPPNTLPSDWSPTKPGDEGDSPPRHPASPERPPGVGEPHLSRSRSRDRDRSDRGERDRSDRDRGDRDRYDRERSDRDRGDRAERVDRGERVERVDRGERVDRVDRGDRERGERNDRDRSDRDYRDRDFEVKIEKTERSERDYERDRDRRHREERKDRGDRENREDRHKKRRHRDEENEYDHRSSKSERSDKDRDRHKKSKRSRREHDDEAV